ncbi:MAG: NAD-dependent epimerase/dehydratase family protein, partial [Candidatus Dormibacteria bacterium]
MRALVTGGAGFIGSHLSEALLRAGHEVTVIDDLSRGRRSQVPAGARFVQADVNDDLGGILAESRPEVVFHEAAQIDVRRSLADPLLDTRVNVLGTVNLLEACVSAGVPRLVFASSGGAIYGDTETIPTPESHPQRPASNYGAAKAAAELYGNVYSQVYGIDFVALRYSNVYGPRQDPHSEAGVVAIFTERMLRGEVPTINGDGTQTR